MIVGGDFSAVDGRRGQRGIAALGPGAGRLLPWANHPSDPILDLALCGKRIYAAMGGPGGTGLAYGLGGQPQVVLHDRREHPGGDVHRPPARCSGCTATTSPRTRTRTLDEFGSSRRIQRHKLFMLTYSGVLERWNPDLSSTAGVLGVWALAAGRGNLYVGGDFTGVHGVAQQRFAILRRR